MQTTSENAAEAESRLFLLSWSMILVLILALSLILFLLVIWVIIRAWRRSARRAFSQREHESSQVDAWRLAGERIGDIGDEHDKS